MIPQCLNPQCQIEMLDGGCDDLLVLHKLSSTMMEMNVEDHHAVAQRAETCSPVHAAPFITRHVLLNRIT